MDVWLIILGMTLVTYLTRVLPLVAMRNGPGPLVSRALRFVPTAVMSALVVPALLLPAGRFQVSASLWAGLTGAAIAWRTHNMFLTLLGGLGAYTILRLMGIV